MRKLLFYCFFAVPLYGQTPVAIQDPSFEQVNGPPVRSDSCGSTWWTSLGWNIGAGSSVFQPANPNPCNIPLPPDGKMVAAAGYGSSFSHDTGVKATDLQTVNGLWLDATYTLKFSVANYYRDYSGYFEANILLGSQELCSTDGWASKKFNEITLICSAPLYIVFDEWPNNVPGFVASPADHNAHLIVSFTAPGWVVLFDKISLTFTPDE